MFITYATLKAKLNDFGDLSVAFADQSPDATPAATWRKDTTSEPLSKSFARKIESEHPAVQKRLSSSTAALLAQAVAEG